MKSTKTTARIIGILFLTVMVTWIAGFAFIEPVLSDPDYLTQVHQNRTRIIIGVLFEVLETAAVLSISVMISPVLKRYRENLARAYFGFRILESVLLIVIAICPLLIISLSQEFTGTAAPDVSLFQSIGAIILTVRTTWSQLILTFFYCLAAFILNFILYQTKLVPRFISLWGLIGVLIVLIHTLYYNFGFKPIPVLGMIMGINELVLGVWLIVKGFNLTAFESVNKTLLT